MKIARTIGTAWGLASVAVAWISASAWANPLDSARFAQCLKGWESWEIGRRMPYFPRLRAGNCAAEGATTTPGTTGFSGMAPRRLRIELWYETDWFPALPGADASRSMSRLREERAGAAMVHFDRLFTAQGFRRVEGAAVDQNRQADGEGVGNAVYERASGGEIRRAELRPGLDVLRLTIEQRSAAGDGLRLPSPEEAFDMTVHGSGWKMFALPGITYGGERMGFSHQHTLQLPLPGSKDASEEVRFAIPVREYRFYSEKGVAQVEVEAVLREAMRGAGWKTLEEKVHYLRGETLYRYFLNQRQLDAGVHTWFEAGRTWVLFTVTEPAAWAQFARAISRFSGQVTDWEIAPELDDAGHASVKTRAEIAVYVAHTSVPERLDANRKILVAPIAGDSAGADVRDRDDALRSARWVAAQFEAQGIDRQHIRLHEEVTPPRVAKFGVARGARVSEFYCVTRSESRPDRIEKTCTCRDRATVYSTTPGECR